MISLINPLHHSPTHKPLHNHHCPCFLVRTVGNTIKSMQYYSIPFQEGILKWLHNSIDPIVMVMDVYSMILVFIDTPAVLLCCGLSSPSCGLNVTHSIRAPLFSVALLFVASPGVHTHVCITETSAAQVYPDITKTGVELLHCYPFRGIYDS